MSAKPWMFLIEGFDNGISIGRSYRDAPEIDGMVIVEGKAKIGEIVPVKITAQWRMT